MKATTSGSALTTLRILQFAIQYAIQGKILAANAKYIPKDMFAINVLYFGPTYSITARNEDEKIKVNVGTLE